MTEKQFADMTVPELRKAMDIWVEMVDTAAGWPSAHEAAKQCREIERIAKNKHGVEIKNPRPITIGGRR